MYGNCVSCSRFTKLNRFKFCATCFAQDELLLAGAHELLQNGGKQSILDVGKKLDVTPKRIFLWIDQGRITTERLEYLCPKCGEDQLNNFCTCQMEQIMIHRDPAVEDAEPPVDKPERFYANRRVSQKQETYWNSKSKICKRQKRDIWLLT
ncbi:MAG: hypothetical protein JXR73_13335 [Candidatus Omnitrophica bacterium]|nr:hypothetical protein [Candidatus Omnitrophota bacterium]